MSEMIQSVDQGNALVSRNVAADIVRAHKIDEEHHNKFLTFLVGCEVLGIDILCIKEIIEYGNVCKVPLVPEYIRGVINLRGNIIPVIDLSARLGLNKGEITKRTSIVLVEVRADDETMEIGVLVDAVNKVFHIANDHIGEVPAFGMKIHVDYIAGMGRIDKEFVVLLNLDKVLDINDLAA